MNSNFRLYPQGHFVRSQYWKKYKNFLPSQLPPALFQVSLGLLLGDGSLYKTKTEGAKLKIEQGALHKTYVETLCSFFREWTFFPQPYAYIPKKGPRAGQILSYSFRTFAHLAFNPLWSLFMESGKKTYPKGLILNPLEALGLCIWVADDGSLNKRTNEIILHTQSFSYAENLQMCQELNEKFSLHATVGSHKKKYWVLCIPARDAILLRAYLVQLPEFMEGKRPLQKGETVFPKGKRNVDDIV